MSVSVALVIVVISYALFGGIPLVFGLWMGVTGLQRLRYAVTYSRMETQSLRDISPSDAGETVKISGSVRSPEGEMPVGPFSGKPHAMCRYRVNRHQKGKNNDKITPIINGVLGTPLRVRDESGQALVNVTPGSDMSIPSERVEYLSMGEEPSDELFERLWEHPAVNPGEQPEIIKRSDPCRLSYVEEQLGPADSVEIIGEVTAETGPNGEPVLQVRDDPTGLAAGGGSPTSMTYEHGFSRLFLAVCTLVFVGVVLSAFPPLEVIPDVMGR